MEYEHLRIERDGPVARLLLNRPDAQNALSVALMRELEAAARAMADDTETRVLIVAGEGRSFSVGADLRDPERHASRAETRLVRQRHERLGATMIRSLREIPQLTIAVVHGYALGGGACIASACDFRLGARGAKVGYPEIDLGLNLMWVALPLLVHLVGPAKAKRMAILGEKLDADTLGSWGFFDEVVDPEERMVAAEALARRYADKAPIPAQMIKRSVDALTSALDQSVMHMDLDQFLLTTETKDHAEAISAFVEKRDAKFQGD